MGDAQERTQSESMSIIESYRGSIIFTGQILDYVWEILK